MPVSECWKRAVSVYFPINIGVYLLSARMYPTTGALGDSDVYNKKGYAMFASSAVLIILGAAAGFLSGLLGIGGGVIYVPALMYFAAVPVHTAIGISLFLIVPSSAVAALRHYMGGSVDLSLVAVVLPTALIGAYLGAYASSYLSAPLLKKIFGVALILIGVNSLFGFTEKLLARQMKDAVRMSSADKLSGRVDVVRETTPSLGRGSGLVDNLPSTNTQGPEDSQELQLPIE